MGETLTGGADFVLSLVLDLDTTLSLPSKSDCGKLENIYKAKIDLVSAKSWDIKNIDIKQSSSTDAICNSFGKAVCDVAQAACYNGIQTAGRPYWDCTAAKLACETGCCGPIHVCNCNSCRKDYKKCFVACDQDKKDCVSNCKKACNCLLGGIITDIKSILSENVIQNNVMPMLMKTVNHQILSVLQQIKICN